MVIFEPYDLRLDTILEAMVAGSGGKLSWENDKELLYYNGEQQPPGGRRVHLDAGYVDFGVSVARLPPSPRAPLLVVAVTENSHFGALIFRSFTAPG